MAVINAKAKIVIDLTQEESDRLDAIVRELRTTKVGFLRYAILNEEKKIKEGE